MVERPDSIEHQELTHSGEDGVVSGLVNENAVLLFSYSCRRRFLLSWTPNIHEVLGSREAEITREGNIFFRYAHPEDRFRLLPLLEESINEGTPYEATYRWTRPDTDQVRWLHCRAHVRQRDGEECLDGFIIDASKAEARICAPRRGPESADSVLGSLPISIVAIDKRFHVTLISGSPLHCTFGDPEFKLSSLKEGANFLMCFTSSESRGVFSEYSTQILEGIRPGYTFEVEQHGRVLSIEVLPNRHEGAVVGLVVVIFDATEHATLRRKVQSNQNDRGFLSLASGVAQHTHDNLHSVLSQLSSLLLHAENPDRVREIATTSLSLIRESTTLTQKLLNLSTSPLESLSFFDVNLVTMAAINRIGGLFFSERRIAVGFGSNVRAFGDESTLTTLTEAMIREMHKVTPEHGLLSVKTSKVTVHDDPSLGIPSGEYAKIILSNMERSPSRGRRDAIPLRGVSELMLQFGDLEGEISRHGGIILVDEFLDSRCSLSILLPSFDQRAKSMRSSAVG